MILGLLFLGLQTYLAFFKPKYFIFTYLLFISSFLGFFSKNILIGGYEIGMFYHSLLMLGNYFLMYKQRKKLPKYISVMLIGTVILFFYGVFYPVINGSSTFVKSIIASREFSTIFFMHYLLVRNKQLNYTSLIKVLSFFGYYFLFILLLYAILKIVPPFYLKSPGQIEYYFPTILSLFLFIKMAQAHTWSKKILALLFLMVWGVGMHYEGHAAITITTILGSLIILFRLPVIQFFKNYKTIVLGLTIFTLLFLFLPMDKYISDFKQNPAIQSRIFINQQRIEYIMESPLQGYGFMHRNTLEFESENQYALQLSFIDSGYIDLLGKFGIVGTVFYLILLSASFFKRNASIVALGLKIFLVQYFLVNITWSVFSFSMGLIAISLAVFLLHSLRYSQIVKN